MSFNHQDLGVTLPRDPDGLPYVPAALLPASDADRVMAAAVATRPGWEAHYVAGEIFWVYEPTGFTLISPTHVCAPTGVDDEQGETHFAGIELAVAYIEAAPQLVIT